MSLFSNTADSNRLLAGESINERNGLEPVGEPDLQFDSHREHFIPLAKSELIRMLADRLPTDKATQVDFANLCKILDSVFHYELRQDHCQLAEDYGPLDPDTALISLRHVDDQERSRRANGFVGDFREILLKANYRELQRDEIDEAINAASAFGVRLSVDASLFDRLHVFVRGELLDKRTIRNVYTMYRKKQIEVPIFQRLVVIFRIKDTAEIKNKISDDHVYLKIFKNIPRTDLDMLLPGTKVRITLLDQGRILVPTLSGIAISLFKLVKALFVATLFTGVWGLIAFLGLVGGTIGYGLKSFFGYLRTKDKYQLNMTQHLYYQNLDNNAGVFFRVLNEAHEQEFREAIVAYYLLWTEADKVGMTKEELDARAEAFIEELIDHQIDFEDEDALGKLSRLGLATQDTHGRWHCTPIDQSLQRLDEAWDNYFHFNNQSKCFEGSQG